MRSLTIVSLLMFCTFCFGDGMQKILINYSSQPGCPDGWVSSRGSCYLFEDTPKEFFDAMDSCEKYGGHLAIVETETENKFLQKQLKKMKDVQYWIGINNIHTEGHIRWLLSDEDIPVSFTNFQPNIQIKNGTNMGGVFSPTHNYQWDYVESSSKIRSICEKKATPNPKCVLGLVEYVYIQNLVGE